MKTIIFLMPIKPLITKAPICKPQSAIQSGLNLQTAFAVLLGLMLSITARGLNLTEFILKNVLDGKAVNICCHK